MYNTLKSKIKNNKSFFFKVNHKYAFPSTAIYLFKINHEKTGTMCENSSKLKIKKSNQVIDVVLVNLSLRFEHILTFVPVFPLLTLNT